MLRRIAVVGDQLDTGGQIESYAGQVCTWGDGGHQVALIGGMAYCEACKSIGTIAKSGGPRRIQFMGETAADGDLVLCNCATPPRIVARLAENSWCDDQDYGASTSSTRAPQSAVEQRATYDEQYTLADSHGRPLWGVHYRVRIGAQIVLSGISDASGKTQRIPADGMKRLSLDVTY